MGLYSVALGITCGKLSKAHQSVNSMPVSMLYCLQYCAADAVPKGPSLDGRTVIGYGGVPPGSKP